MCQVLAAHPCILLGLVLEVLVALVALVLGLLRHTLGRN